MSIHYAVLSVIEYEGSQVEGTPGAHVHWVGPHIPPFGGGYAIEGVDTWEIRP